MTRSSLDSDAETPLLTITRNYGSHTLRKTWGYQQRVQNNAPLPLLVEAYGHSTQRQTLDYLGIQAEEISDLYTLAL